MGHGPHASQITSWKTLVTQTLFDVSNEIDPIFVTRFLVIEWLNVPRKTFGKTRMAIAKLFAVNANAKNGERKSLNKVIWKKLFSESRKTMNSSQHLKH